MMQEKKHFFGIGVASYEQHDGLIESVKNLAEVQKKLAERNIFVPIYISDNNSRNFPLQEIQSLGLLADFSLFHQPENIGFSGNIAFLLAKIDAEYILILGCGDLLVPNALETLILHLMQSEMAGIKLLGGTLTNVDNQIFDGDEFSVSPNLLAVNPAISLNVWNSKFLDHQLLSKSRKDSWPHIELAIGIHDKYPHACYFFFRQQVLTLDQPPDGWHNSEDFLRIFLHLDKLVRANPGINLGPSIKDNWHSIGSWIYYFRRSRNERVPLIALTRILIRLISKPHAAMQIALMATLPKSVIRLLSKVSRHFRLQSGLGSKNR